MFDNALANGGGFPLANSQTGDAPIDGALLWKDALGELQLQMTRTTFDSWLNGSAFSHLEPPDLFVVTVVNGYAQDWLNSRLKDTLERTLSAVARRRLRFHAVVPAFDRQGQDKDSGVKPPNINGNGVQTASDPPPISTPSKIAKAPVVQSTDNPDTSARENARQVVIQAAKTLDPKKGGYTQTNHYAVRFWRPFLGGKAFDLLLVLSAYHYEVTTFDLEWPTIEHLARKLGFGTRHTILGRRYGDRPDQEGLLDVLAQHRLLQYHREGPAVKSKYVIDELVTVDMLPMLTPAQVGMLEHADQVEHAEWLERFKHVIDVESWGNLA